MGNMRKHLWFALHDRPTLYGLWTIVLTLVFIVLDETEIWRFD